MGERGSGSGPAADRAGGAGESSTAREVRVAAVLAVVDRYRAEGRRLVVARIAREAGANRQLIYEHDRLRAAVGLAPPGGSRAADADGGLGAPGVPGRSAPDVPGPGSVGEGRPTGCPTPSRPRSAGVDAPSGSPARVPARAGPAGGLRRGPTEPVPVDRVAAAVRAVVRTAHPELGGSDVGEAVRVGVRAYRRAWVGPDAGRGAAPGRWSWRRALDAALAAALSVAGSVGGVPGTAGSPAGGGGGPAWQGRAGRVVPVLGVSRGVGASLLAEALFRAVSAAGVRALLVDAAGSTRSSTPRGVWSHSVGVDGAPGGAIEYRRYGPGWIAGWSGPTGTPTGSGPGPHEWLAGCAEPEVTVVDPGGDAWSSASPRGAGAWLRTAPGTPPADRQRPVLVSGPTQPSVDAAEAGLVRLRPWVEDGRVVGPAGWVMYGLRRRPVVVGREVAGLGEPILLPCRGRGLGRRRGAGASPAARAAAVAAREVGRRLGVL